MSGKKDGGLDFLGPEYQDVVGWKPIEGVDGRVNTRGWALTWVVIKKLVQREVKALKALYDQPKIFENPGAIIVARQGDRILLAENFRDIGERFPVEDWSDYMGLINAGNFWHQLLELLGNYNWEAPRGIKPKGEKKYDNIEEFILDTARIEGLEEAGVTLSDLRVVGRVNANTTFFPYAQYVVQGEIVSLGDAQPEDLEIIRNRRLFTMAELREMNRRGEFVDGLTMAAMAMCGLSL